MLREIVWTSELIVNNNKPSDYVLFCISSQHASCDLNPNIFVNYTHDIFYAHSF